MIWGARHELGLLAASQPALPALLIAGRLARPIRRVPRLGWVVGDPVVARQILNDGKHFTLLGDGGVGHLWAQVLGDWVYDVFDGKGHHAFRGQVRDLFTDDNSRDLVDRVIGPRLAACTDDLRSGRTVDVADLARVLVGRILADLLGLGLTAADDGPYREVFAEGERLAALAIGTLASTRLDPGTVAEARRIVAGLTGGVAHAFRTADNRSMLGRCRELGVRLEHAEGLATLLMVAGTETAASAMARTVALLHDTGEQDGLLNNPELLGDAVREGLRVTTPAPLIGRAVVADVTMAGRTMRAGEQVKILTWTINNAAGGYRLDRGYLPDTRQLWFGAGRHLCLGAQLARAELAGIITALTAPGKKWQVVERRYRRKVLIPSYETLRVRLTARRAAAGSSG